MVNVNDNSSLWRSIKDDWLILLCLFVSVSSVFAYAKFFILPVTLLLLRKRRRLQCRKDMGLLFIFSLFYVIFLAMKGLMTSRSDYLAYFFPPLFFMAGSYLGSKYKNNEKATVSILFVLLLSYAAVRFVQMFKFFSFINVVVLENRVLEDAAGSNIGGATIFAVAMSMIIVNFSLLFVPYRKGVLLLIRILGVSAAMLSTWYMAKSVTRTSIIEATVMIALSVYMIITSRENKNRGLIFLIGSAIILIGAYTFERNSNVHESIIYSYELRNANNDIYTAGSRSERWITAAEQLIVSPLGTSDGKIGTSGYAYAHNMWLDVGLMTGWIPFIILLVISIKNMSQSIRLWKDRNTPYWIRLYLFAIFLMFIMSCGVEPVCEGMYSHFLLYLIFCGMVCEMSSHVKTWRLRTDYAYHSV